MRTPRRTAAEASEPSKTMRSIAQRNAASVLPDPVGAAMSVDSEAMMCGQAFFCAGEGASNRRSNHARVAGWKADLSGLAPVLMVSPTIRRT